MSPRIARHVAHFEQLGRTCERSGSPLAGALLRAMAAALGQGGPLAGMVLACALDDAKAVIGLRLLGALHRAALDGRAPDLARFFATAGGRYAGSADESALGTAAIAALEANPDLVRTYLAGPPQTNEPARSIGLLVGFLDVARQTGLPLDLMEIGTSAGLNLCFDRYHYRLGDADFGDPGCGITLQTHWTGALPALDAPLAVRQRAGTDIAPIDATDPIARQRLLSYVWPDQRQRLDRLQAALGIAAGVERDIARESADAWLARRLAAPAPGAARVVFHSMMWQYMPAPVQAGAQAAIIAAGERAGVDAPLAWLRMEPEPGHIGFQIRLTCWPGGHLRWIAAAHPHGAWVRTDAPPVVERGNDMT
ncbi:MAG: DUF2332 domain-containing protein [Gammaproteobacteria bacterium]